MSIILLLMLFLIWMAGPAPAAAGDLWPNLLLFFSFYVALVVLLGLWSRVLVRRAASANFHHKLRRFNQGMFAARLMVPIWFSVGVWGLGWGAVVGLMGSTVYRSVIGLLVGTMPAFATWMGLWWSQYPAERALREQNLLVDLDNDIPLYQPPRFRSYFFTNLRVQVLFTLLPVMMIVLLRDGIVFTILFLMGKPWNPDPPPAVELGAMLGSAGLVFIFAPAMLKRVLSTSPMPPSALRRRLDALCRRAGVRYREILVWNTDNHVGNAAVMGVLPWLRYVLLTDVLLERMTDEEIEAVFAHELGHIVHRHMIWYAIFFVMMGLVTGGAEGVVDPLLRAVNLNEQAGMALAVIAVAAFFGALSRRCERQADVYAARTMEAMKDATQADEGLFAPAEVTAIGASPLVPMRAGARGYVGKRGAAVFNSALRRVAGINNIPITPRTRSASGILNRLSHLIESVVEWCNNWLHGSIASRMRYLQDLSEDPRRTWHFDRTMFWLYGALLFALFTSAFFSGLQSW